MGGFGGLGNFKCFALMLPPTAHDEGGEVPELYMHRRELIQWGSLVCVEGAVVESMFSCIFRVLAVGAD